MQEIENVRIYYDVPYSQKEQAKQLGAKWNNDKKLWFAIESNKKISDLFKIHKPTEFYCAYCNLSMSKRSQVHRDGIARIDHMDDTTDLIQHYICNLCKKAEKNRIKDEQIRQSKLTP